MAQHEKQGEGHVSLEMGETIVGPDISELEQSEKLMRERERERRTGEFLGPCL